MAMLEDFLRTGFGLAFATGGAVGAFFVLIGSCLPKKTNLHITRWLKGEYEESWAQTWCLIFDKVFGTRHLTLRCFLVSAVFSLGAVAGLYFLFSEVLDVLKFRIFDSVDLLTAMAIAAALNIVPDYASLLETRLLLQKLKKVRSVWIQLLVLAADILFSAIIIWGAIASYRFIRGEPQLSAIELLALFSVFSIFFYSSFFTSAFAWLYVVSTWLVRLFQNRRWLYVVLDVEERPVTVAIASVAALTTFVATAIVGPAFMTSKQRPISAFDAMLCNALSDEACKYIGMGLTRDEGKAVQYLEHECALSKIEDSQQCLKAIETYFGGNVVTASALFERACDAGSAYGCSYLARLYLDGQTTVSKWNAATLFRRACDMELVFNCTILGQMYEDGQNVVQDYARAMQFYGRACDGGDAVGCGELMLIYMDGKGVEPSATKAAAFGERACDLGELTTCNITAQAYETGRNWRGHDTEKDPKKALELYRRGCDGGDLSACRDLGRLYEEGRGTAQNILQAFLLYRDACNSGGMSACTSLGLLYDTGKGVIEKDKKKAADFYEKACSGGNTKGCTNLGVILYRGNGVPRDDKRAAALFRKACKGDNAQGCKNLAAMYAIGHGVEKDQLRATELYKKAAALSREDCENGTAAGCERLGDLYEKGLGVEEDQGLATEFFRKACILREAERCN